MITRDNYEEFFLLYVDNELSIADRQRVERFVDDHPDLREEWEILRQCQLQPEQPPAFPDKSVLRKPEVDAAAADPAVDFLSYIDGELHGKELTATEDLIRQHPHALQELELWRQTISYPDMTLTFPDKESLYKKGGGKKIVLLPWFKAGVAAAIAGVIALLLFLPATHRQNAGSIASAPPPSAPRHAAPAPIHATPAPINVPPVQTNALPAPATAATTAATATLSTPATIISHKKNALPVTPVATAALYPSRDKQKKTEEVKDDPVSQDAVGTGEAARTSDIALAQTVNSGHPSNPGDPVNPGQPVNAGHLLNPGHLVTLAVQVDIPKDQSSFATQALQHETNDADNNSFVEAEQAAPDKGKFRGLFRKVTRAFGKTADRDKDGQRQVLIGAFQFALN
jgi:anti-sigma factor RsiW